MTPKKTLGASTKEFPNPQKTYQEMVAEADDAHVLKKQEQDQYVEKIQKANQGRDGVTTRINPSYGEKLKDALKRAQKEVEQEQLEELSRSAEPAVMGIPGEIFTSDEGPPMAYSPYANLAMLLGSENLEPRLEVELLKMRRVLSNEENQKYITDNFDFLVGVLRRVIQNTFAEDFNVPPK